MKLSKKGSEPHSRAESTVSDKRVQLTPEQQVIEALRKIQDIQLRKGEYCVCGKADSEASTRADGEDYVQMNYSDWAALSQYICVQDEKIKQLETELDSVIELSSID